MTQSGPKGGRLVPRTSLPSPVQRWLDRALPKDLAPPSTIQIEQVGSLDVRGRWTAFEAVGIYTGSPLTFSWQARLRLMPAVWVTAEDGHDSDRGWGCAHLWGWIPMGERTGPQVLRTPGPEKSTGAQPRRTGFPALPLLC